MASMWIPGAKIVRALKDAGALSGSVKKVVWHTTENDPTKTSAVNVAKYLNSVGSQVHVVWNPTTGEIVQMIPANRGGRGLVNKPGGVETNTSGGIVVQIEVVGRATQPFTSGPCNGLDTIINWLRSLGVPDVWPAGDLKAYPASYGGTRSTTAWSQSGHFGHSQVPENVHGDPGDIDQTKITGAVKPAPKPVVQPAPAVPRISAADKIRVIAVQRALHQVADGAFGPATARAINAVVFKNLSDVRYLQRVVGVTADGIWGPNSEGARIGTIKLVQRIIGVTPDGVWGKNTSAAWLEFYKRTYGKY